MDKGDEFLEARLERKPYALAFIVLAFAFFVMATTRMFIGRPFGITGFIIAVVLLAVGCVWFRIAYLSQEELKRRREDG